MAECDQVGGAGCGLFVGRSPNGICADSGDSAGDTTDTADTGEVKGSGVCASAAGPGWLALFAMLFVWARRLLFVLLLISPAHAQEAVDAWSLRTMDGGPWVMLPDPDVGRPWTMRAALSAQYARGLVEYWRDNQDPIALLDTAVGTEVGASVRIAGLIRMGGSMVSFPLIVADTHVDQQVLGDLHVWAALPLHARRPDRTGWDLAWSVDAGIPTGEERDWVGDPSGSISSHLSLGGTTAGFRMLGTLGARLSIPAELPGMEWGNRLLFGAGVQHDLIGPTWATVELGGSVGIPPQGAEGDSPVEALFSVGGIPGSGIGVTGGIGAGLTHGLGSPSIRVLLMVDARPRDWPDTDLDGIVDIHDGCVLEPEDEDEIQDRDGCPEEDADGDKILDPVDRCPLVPEEYNGVADEDGCPDVAVRVHFEVLSADVDTPIEQATLQLGEAPAVGLVDGYDVVVAPGPISLHAESPGFAPVDEEWQVPARPTVTREITLHPLRFGSLCATLADDADVAIAGAVDAQLIPKEGRCFQAQAGAKVVTVSATGYTPREVPVDVPRDGELRIHVQLKLGSVWREGARLEVRESLRFPVDSSDPENLPSLDDVAAWLKEHPEVRLLRIEGHADQTGASAYNRDLSLRRATVVRDRLVTLGIAPERLEIVASGEAKRPGDDPRRLVEFWVIVWDD